MLIIIYDFAIIWNIFDSNVWNAKNKNNIKQVEIFCLEKYVNFYFTIILSAVITRYLERELT